MFLAGIEKPDATILLFCARGGFRLRLIYERFLAASGLESPVATCDLMVSRVVAVRNALLAGSNAAFEQIGYEMGASTLRDTLHAVSGTSAFGPATDLAILDAPCTRKTLADLLLAPEGKDIRNSIEAQADLFSEHLATCLGGRTAAILCDSGLAGSTMQLLEAGIPRIQWSCLLFARSNYKKFKTPHFARTTGLSVQADGYSPLDARTAVLRYWHLIESTLEPDLPSVASFSRVNGVVTANLEIPGWRDHILPVRGEFLEGVLAYINALPQAGAPARILQDVGPAYRNLRRALVWPTRADVDLLNIGTRSIDFGRSDAITVLSGKPGLMGALRGNLWREGAVASTNSLFSRPALAGIEVAYAARWALRSIKGRRLA